MLLGKRLSLSTADPFAIIRSGEEGELVRPTVEDLVRGLRYVLGDPKYRHKIATSFQRKVLENFTWKHNVDRVLASIN